MKINLITFSILAVLLLFLNGCYYDTESLLYPSGNCDTTNITYSFTIKTIMQNNACLDCHGGLAASGGNIILDNYINVKSYAQSGRLYGSLNHEPGYSPMPKSGNKMNSCELKKVKIWIDSGIPNN